MSVLSHQQPRDAFFNFNETPRIFQDPRGVIPLKNAITSYDVVTLLTPVIVPHLDATEPAKDPFEDFGRSLSHYRLRVQHVPYTVDGITSAHVDFLKISKLIVFVATAFAPVDELLLHSLSLIAQLASENRSLIALVHCGSRSNSFPIDNTITMVTVPSVSPPMLDTAAWLLMHGTNPLTTSLGDPWIAKPWDPATDLEDMLDLWQSAVPKQFDLKRESLRNIFNRPGAAQHYVVRDTRNWMLLGFCAAYLTFTDQSDRLVGSIAALLVNAGLRGRGIRRLLYDTCYSTFERRGDVGCIQMGTNFPRLFYGFPKHFANTKWLAARGWDVSARSPGAGKTVADWVLQFSKHESPNLSSAGLVFRPCELTDMEEVRRIVQRQSTRRNCFGWFDLIAKTLDGSFHQDVIVGFEGETLVAVTLVYVPYTDSPAAKELQWTSLAGPNLGGATCICINDENPDLINRRETVLSRLLQACQRYLAVRGADGLFIDAARGDDSIYRSMGFEKWASYLEVWRMI